MSSTATRLCAAATFRRPRESLDVYLARQEIIKRHAYQWSRGELRGIPLHWIAYGRPPLAYPTDDTAGQGGALARLIDDQVQQYKRYKETRNLKQLRFMALRIRRTWSSMIDLAEGTELLGSSIPASVMFRAD